MEADVEQVEQEIRGVVASLVGKPVAALSPAFRSRLQALHSQEYLRGVKDPLVRWFLMSEGWQHHWFEKAVARIKQGAECGR